MTLTRALSVLVITLLCGCATSSPELRRFDYTQAQMGLPFHISLYAPDAESAEAGAKAAFARISALNDIMSDYDTDSELSRLSQTSGHGVAVRVSDDLWTVLERAQSLARETDGAFDVTCGPAVSLWRKARREKKMPDQGKLKEAREAVGYEKMRLNRSAQTVELLVPYMRLDLGAIAKGYAIDEALKVLRARGVSRALVSGAGDMRAGDAPPGKRGWRVELAPLDISNAPPAEFVILQNMALATSGDLFQRLEINGVRYSHIVDPRTGVGLTDHGLVVVIAPDALTADSLSTAISVLGPENGIALVQRKQHVEARIIRVPDQEIEVTESPRFRRFKSRE